MLLVLLLVVVVVGGERDWGIQSPNAALFIYKRERAIHVITRAS